MDTYQLVEEAVNIPYELLQWAKTAEAEEVVNKFVEKTQCAKVKLEQVRPGKSNFRVWGQTYDAVRAARSLLEMHLLHEVEYQQQKQITERAKQDLLATNEEFEKGQRTEFTVAENLIGLVIGKGGANVTKVKEMTGVDRIVVDPKSRTVRIRGEDPEAVKRAKDMLEYQEISLPISMDQFRPLYGDKGKNLNEICKKSGCVNINIDRPDEDSRVLKILGVRKSVDLARDLVESQLEHESKLKLLKEDEQEIKRRLMRIDSEFREFNQGPVRRSDQGSFQRPAVASGDVEKGMNNLKLTKDDEQVSNGGSSSSGKQQQKSNKKQQQAQKETGPVVPTAQQRQGKQNAQQQQNQYQQQASQQVQKRDSQNKIEQVEVVEVKVRTDGGSTKSKRRERKRKDKLTPTSETSDRFEPSENVEQKGETLSGMNGSEASNSIPAGNKGGSNTRGPNRVDKGQQKKTTGQAKTQESGAKTHDEEHSAGKQNESSQSAKQGKKSTPRDGSKASPKPSENTPPAAPNGATLQPNSEEQSKSKKRNSRPKAGDGEKKSEVAEQSSSVSNPSQNNSQNDAPTQEGDDQQSKQRSRRRRGKKTGNAETGGDANASTSISAASQESQNEEGKGTVQKQSKGNEQQKRANGRQPAKEKAPNSQGSGQPSQSKPKQRGNGNGGNGNKAQQQQAKKVKQ